MWPVAAHLASICAVLALVGADASQLEQCEPKAARAAERKLPSRVLAAYANWGQCDDKLVQAADDGVNVLIWFSINLETTANGTAPRIGGPAAKGPDFYDCVAEKVSEMSRRGRSVVHLISIGGWNSPHPDTRFSADEWWAEWKRWNEEEVARPGMGWMGFAGFDWDIEGNDDGAHHGNVFAMKTLDLMGQLSVLAKADSFLVAMAPAQSYLDAGTTEFSRSVKHAPRDPWQPDFMYTGRNVYAYLLARYGVSTFDFISVQLYEGWSSANYAISEAALPASLALEAVVNQTLSEFEVDFTTDPLTSDLGRSRLRIDAKQLVIGLANGWTGPPPNKFLLIWPEDCAEAWASLGGADGQHQPFAGFMFWNVQDEGTVVPGSTPRRELHLARELSAFLKP